jgi:hypothetical protein
MHLDGRLVATKPCRRKQLEAQIDGCRVQRVEALVQIHDRAHIIETGADSYRFRRTVEKGRSKSMG